MGVAHTSPRCPSPSWELWRSVYLCQEMSTERLVPPPCGHAARKRLREMPGQEGLRSAEHPQPFPGRAEKMRRFPPLKSQPFLRAPGNGRGERCPASPAVASPRCPPAPSSPAPACTAGAEPRRWLLGSGQGEAAGSRPAAGPARIQQKCCRSPAARRGAGAGRMAEPGLGGSQGKEGSELAATCCSVLLLEGKHQK